MIGILTWNGGGPGGTLRRFGSFEEHLRRIASEQGGGGEEGVGVAARQLRAALFPFQPQRM